MRMNAKQAMKKAQKLVQEEVGKNTQGVCIPDDEREKLPDIYEAKYKSENLKTKIADLGMWSMIPSVTGSLNSAYGVRRLKENNPLHKHDEPFAISLDLRILIFQCGFDCFC